MSEATARNTLWRLRRMSQDARQAFLRANSLGTEAVHHLYLDRSEIAVYLQTRRLKAKNSWKFYATFHRPYFIHHAKERVGLAKRVYHAVNRWTLGHMLNRGVIDGLFVHTEGIKKKLLAVYGDVVEPRITVIPVPAEDPTKLTQEEARDLLRLPCDIPVLLFFGGLRWDKGPDIFLDALPLIDGAWLAVVAGEQDRFGQLEIGQCQRRLKHPEQLIANLNYIEDADVAAYFMAADAVILPYRAMFKGASGVLQHAAAAGKPVVASNTDEIGVIVRGNQLGIVVQPECPRALAQGIREFLASRHELSARVRPHALEYAKGHNWRIMATKIRETYFSPKEK